MQKIIKIWNLYYMTFWKGLWGTLWLSAMTVFFGTLLGMLIALMHMGKSKILRGFADIYIEILRGTPILLQLSFFWIGLPKIVPFELTDTQCILVALIVNASAYISEIIRAGINAVDKGQWEAARSIGLTETHVMTRIILPQAVKNILPALGTELIVLIKDTSVAGVIARTDLTKAAARKDTLLLYVLKQNVATWRGDEERFWISIDVETVTVDNFVNVPSTLASPYKNVRGTLALVGDRYGDPMLGFALVHVKDGIASHQRVVTGCTYYERYTTEAALQAAAKSYGGLTGE